MMLPVCPLFAWTIYS